MSLCIRKLLCFLVSRLWSLVGWSPHHWWFRRPPCGYHSFNFGFHYTFLGFVRLSIILVPHELTLFATMSSTSRPLPRPLHLVSSSTGASSSPNPGSAGLRGPPSAPLSFNRGGMNDFNTMNSRPSPRRQSSISYNTSSSKARSPGLGRSNSLGSGTVLEGEKGTIVENGKIRDAEPVTLAEKHADLLRFIAQKESKCLELRTQLAQHEADLLLLKRKWERIVSKGSPSTSRTDASTSVGIDMLDGIREGVQTGLGKMFAVLEPSSGGPSASPPSTSLPSTSTQPIKFEHHSQRLMGDISVSSSKRASISTASSSSTRDRSSLSDSRSSASSLFDELASLDRLASSIEGSSTTCLSSDINGEFPATRPSRAVKRNSTPIRNSTSVTQSPTEGTSETSNPDDDPSSKRRRSRPSSINFSQFPSPFSSSISPESLTPLGKPVGNWVPTGLNRKWEELKGNETISKQSKRASILLTDMLSVLAPPISSPKASTSATQRKGRLLQSPSHQTLDLTFLDAPRMSPSPAPSLLDEEDGCSMGEVLQPEIKTPCIPTGVDASMKAEDKQEDDEWNW
ncbi:hypothetical protein K439DRAFT_473541 [Ramaria rubella]|nr:hypothetical protein K439DRAFT_473541 [Ramaria rubella]